MQSDQLPPFFHFVITIGWVQQQSYIKPTKKWATGQSCIREEVTSYKIHNLVPFVYFAKGQLISKGNFSVFNSPQNELENVNFFP